MLVPPPWKAQHDSYIDNYHRTGVPKVNSSFFAVAAGWMTERLAAAVCMRR